MTWPVGTIVVCVDARGPFGVCAPLTEGAYYTIRAYMTHRVCRGEIRPGVYVNELRNPASFDGTEWSYNASRFRIAESTHSEAGTVRAREPVRA